MAQKSRLSDFQWRDLSTYLSRLPFSKLAQGSALSVVGVAGNATADNASIAAGTDGHVLRRSGTSLGFGSIAVSALANGTSTVLTSSTTSNQNNWAPGISGDTVVFWSGAGDISITGVSNSGVTTGTRFKFVNTGTNVATFAHQSGSSSAGNKFRNAATSGGTPVAGSGYIEYQYDGTDWRLISHEQGAWITPTYAGGNYTASTGTWTVDSGDVTTQAYLLRGRTLTVTFYLVTTSVSATPASLSIGNGAWGGFTLTKTGLTLFLNNDNGVGNAVGFIQLNAAGTTIPLSKITGTWAAAANTTNVFGTIMFEVQ
jgi:hypothetical protein